MLITKLHNRRNDTWRAYYWSGTEDPVDLHIDHSHYGDADVHSITLVVYNQCVYVLEQNWSILLYDSTVPGDADVIQARLLQQTNKTTLRARTLLRLPRKQRIHQDGIRVWHQYVRYGAAYTILTSITNKSSIQTEMSATVEFDNEYREATFVDTITYEKWHTHRVYCIDGSSRIVISNGNYQSNIEDNGKYMIRGISDGSFIVESTCIVRGIDYNNYLRISAYDTDQRIELLSGISRGGYVRVDSHFLFILVSWGVDNMYFNHVMYMVDTRNAYVYEFTHECRAPV